MRIAVRGATLVLVTGATAGCGGSPDDASEADFCEAFTSITEASGDFDATRDGFAELEDVGTPEGIPDDAREGFDIAVDLSDQADSQADAERLAEELDAEDDEKLAAFLDYTLETCTDLPGLGDLPELPSDLPTGLPSELPTEIPSDLRDQLPSEFPSELLSELPSGVPTELPSELPSELLTLLTPSGE
jgi:hypothetical protein